MARWLWGMAVVILALLNYSVWQKEQLLKDGATVLLELAPRDPRSLMQGDYMVLRYHVANDIGKAVKERNLDGRAVIALDADGVGRFVRIDDGTALAAGEQRLFFRKRGHAMRLGAEAFFFEEGRAGHFQSAKYGELTVATDGEAVLTGLRGADRKPLVP
jgi:uncharacterized membrane-anchored protein